MTNTCVFKKDNNHNRETIKISSNILVNNNWTKHPVSNLYPINAASGIISTVSDMCNFLINLLISKNKYKELFEPNIITSRHNIYNITDHEKYTLGLYMQKYRYENLFYHYGYTLGFTTYLCLIPKRDLGIFIFTNTDKSLFPQIVTYELIEILNGNSNTQLKSKLLLEKNISFSYRKSYEECKNMCKIATEKILYFDKYGLYGKFVINSNPYIILNNNKIELICKNENTYFQYINELDEYLLIKIMENKLIINGTSNIDTIEIPYYLYN
jgi:hypothetical protein